MKKIILFILLFLILIDFSSYSQIEYSNNVHGYIVTQAWEYLKLKKSYVNWYATDMASHIGNGNEEGSDTYPWADGKIGSYSEVRRMVLLK